jgi:tetratricopeptide (TPR) repeat protein
MIALLLAAAMVAGAPPPPQSAPPSGAAWYEFLLARHHESRGDTDAAIAAYKRAAELDPASAEIPSALAELYARQNKVDECIAAGEQALKVNPDSVSAHRILGLVFASLSQSRGRARAGRNYAAEAIQHLERVQAASRAPDTSILVSLGRLYIQAGTFDKAIPPLRQLVEDEPQYSVGVAMLAQAYSAAGRTAEATELLERLAKDDPDYLTMLAQQHERANEWDKAADAYGRAVEHNKDNDELKSRWAIALMNSSDATKAASVLQQIAAKKPGDLQTLYLLSQAQRRSSDFTGAEASARQIIATNPDGPLGPYALAQVFEDQRQYQKVVDVLTPVVAAYTARTDATPRPDIARLYLHLGFAQQQLKDLARAATTFEQGQRYARDASLLFQLGSVLEQQKRYADAERTFRDILQRDPEHAPTLNYLGYMLADRGERLDEAVGFIKRALEAEPDNASYLDSLGWAYVRMNRLDLAEDPLRRASADLTKNSVVQDHWGDLLFKLRRYTDAIAAWERALAGDGESIDKAQIEKKIKSARDKK